MKWIKKIFGKKHEDKIEKKSEETKQEPVPTQSTIICAACELPIESDQKSISKAGKRYHLSPCWRNLQKLAKQYAFG